MMDFVRRNVPGERRAIVHGDFKFDNMVSSLLLDLTWNRSVVKREGLLKEFLERED